MPSLPRSFHLPVLALCVLAAFLMGAPTRAAEQEEWELVKKPTFTFSVPKTLKKNSVQGFEGMIERWEGEGIKLWFDTHPPAEDREHWPKGTTIEEVKLAGDPAKMAMINQTDPKVNSTSTVAIRVRRAEANLALGGTAWCDNEKAMALAKKILFTVRLTSPDAK